jgi:hypothetical protein
MSEAFALYMLDVLNRVNDWEWSCFEGFDFDPHLLVMVKVYKFTNVENRFNMLLSRNFKELDHYPVDIDFNNDKSVVEFIRNHIEAFCGESYYDRQENSPDGNWI